MPTLTLNQTTLIKFVGLVGCGIFLYLIRDIFWILFVAFILTSALNPLVRYLEKRGLSGSTIIFMLLAVMIVLTAVFALVLIPPIAQEMQRISGILPTVLDQNIYDKLGLGQWISFDKFQGLYQQSVNSAFSWVRSVSLGLVQFGIGLLGAFIAAITIIALTFYLLLDHDKIVIFLVKLFPKQYGDFVERLILKTESRLGTWMHGQSIVMLIMGSLTYLGLMLLGVNSALAIALIACLLELVPFAGPALTAIPALLVASSSQSTFQIFGVAGLFFVLQQVEGNLVVPKIMNKAIGLHPIIVILAVTIGAHQGGPLGALLAIPLATVAFVFYQEWMDARQKVVTTPQILEKSAVQNFE